MNILYAQNSFKFFFQMTPRRSKFENENLVRSEFFQIFLPDDPKEIQVRIWEFFPKTLDYWHYKIFWTHKWKKTSQEFNDVSLKANWFDWLKKNFKSLRFICSLNPGPSILNDISFMGQRRWIIGTTKFGLCYKYKWVVWLFKYWSCL